MSLIEFSLRPLDEVEPWGTPPDLKLHWFGLSDGSYHFDLGDVCLLEYREGAGRPGYVEYQLARLHEDLVEMAPFILTPIPDAIVGLLPGGSVASAHHRLAERRAPVDDPDDAVGEAMEAFRVRLLDSLYLSPGFGVWLWSHGNKVVVEWDDRGLLIDGHPAWTASVGKRELARDEFIEELRSFDQRLMNAMTDRIRMVSAHGLRADVQLDVPRLQADHAERATWLANALTRQHPSSDWEVVARELCRESRDSA
jgi:hypothetical protein